jgi:Integrase core domain
MVKRLKLNEKTVRKAENLGRDYQIFDSDVRGFSITIYPSGNRAFTLDYRVAGRQRRMTIGRWRRHYNTKRPHSSLGYRPPAPEVVQWPASPPGPASPATPTVAPRPVMH